jgi:hypothetical protein
MLLQSCSNEGKQHCNQTDGMTQFLGLKGLCEQKINADWTIQVEANMTILRSIYSLHACMCMQAFSFGLVKKVPFELNQTDVIADRTKLVNSEFGEFTRTRPPGPSGLSGPNRPTGPTRT